MTARFHLPAPTQALAAPAPLPGFITDLRPRPRLREQRAAASAARLAGVDGLYVPFDPEGLESLVVAGALLREATAQQVTAEFHPGITTPVYAAKLTASAQRFTGSRLAWRLHVDLDPAVARAQGDFLEAADRYARADEFLTVARGVWHGSDYSYEGRFYEVLGGGFPAGRSSREFPTVYLSGVSDEALELSAKHAGVHVFAPDQDRSLAPTGVKTALVLPVVARDDEAEAALAARRSGFDARHGALIGSHASVAEALRQYAAQGVDEFFLQLPDPVSDGYGFGQLVLPLTLIQEAAHVG
jgi:alkanesulfonate monooxygenase